MNIYEKLQKIRSELKLTKTGVVSFGNMKREYFSLNDILPEVNKAAAKEKICCMFNLCGESATLKIVNSEKPEEEILFSVPIANATINGNAVQGIGATQTYLRRYLYLNAFEIAEFDEIEEQTPQQQKTQAAEKKQTPSPKPATKQPPKQAAKQPPKQATPQQAAEIWTAETNAIFTELMGKLPEERKAVYRNLLNNTSPSDIIAMARAEVAEREQMAATPQQAAEVTEQDNFDIF